MAFYPLLKILGLVATGIVHYWASTPPQPPPSAEERHCATSKFEKALPWFRFGSLCTLFIALFNETLLVFTSMHPEILPMSPSVYHIVCPRAAHAGPHDAHAMQALSIPFTIGLILALAGGAIRIWCYRVLGKLFTYEVALRPAHTLVKCAPYNIVRHPSYTGLYMHIVGITIMHFSPGGWNRECGVIYTKGYGSWVVIWLSLVAYTLASVWGRGEIEDTILHRRFGVAWEQYRREVPFKFFPFLV